jgi:hypothetical protein
MDHLAYVSPIVNSRSSALTYRFLVGSLALALLTGFPSTVLAQVPGASGGSSALNAALIKLFGSNNAFSAKAEFHVTDKSGTETDTVPMGFQFLEGKLRMDIDMTQIKSIGMPAANMPTLKQLGMDQSIVITRPDRKVVLSVFPKAKSYAEIPMPKEDLAAIDKNFKMEKSPLGKETVNGHPCEINKITLTGDRGEKTEAKVWNATDLKDFPVQIQMTDADTTVLIKFKDVKLAKPDIKEFEAPSGLTKYDSAEALRDSLVLKPQTTSGTNK